MKNSFLHRSLMRAIAIIAFLFINQSFFYAQEKMYANNKDSRVIGLLCGASSVDSPENAVGSNESDFALLNIPLAVACRAELDLSFPAATTQYSRKVVIGIGRPDAALSVGLLGGVTVESFLGTTSNNDSKIVDDAMLKIGQDPKQGIIEFTPTKYFDKIRITLNGGLLGLNGGLQVFYAYHTPVLTNCGNPPFNPLYYYPFDGNGEDQVSGYNLTYNNSSVSFVTNDKICGSAADSGVFYNEAASSRQPGSETYAFWMKVQPGWFNDESLTIQTISGISITNDGLMGGGSGNLAVIPKDILQGNIGGKIMCGQSIEKNTWVYITMVWNTEEKKLCLYKNGGTPDCMTTNSLPNSPAGRTFIHFEDINIDDLIIYDRALSATEVKSLACSYGTLPGCTSGSTTSKVAPAKTEALIVSPNPTQGTVTLGGNILLAGSDISVLTTSGKEVYSTKFQSETFELPSSLPGGVYIVNVQTRRGETFSRKIILSR
ncbi:T9SS type A sorting domain-containing protein [Chryseobacterium gallinarum]|uniref:T9SS type A sorting domain-containing protein n=1 Tax=Chryseobacterium gallinarum TaxID=1324352 RepID=A0ABX6KLK7_CHRGL|nr:T9SS type A sorting domain-containing protein [Chryseobacterium gallinarum]QIY89537.1 T9SS type A sorting domain-containing protein [Chryseobacterium gallinarum]